MSRRPNPVPSYGRHKQSGQARVVLRDRLSGIRKEVLLGPYDSDESKAKYHRVVAEWQACHQSLALAAGPAPGLTVDGLIVAFWPYAEQRYRHPSGTPTSEQKEYRYSLQPLQELYGSTPARDFDQKALKAVRHKLIEAGQCRAVVNRRVGRIIRLFKWAAGEGLVGWEVYHRIQVVPGLEKGRGPAPETEPIRPVSDEYVAAVLTHVRPTVRAMIRLQALTGMRPGEVCAMRPCDIDMTEKEWVYRPAHHKTAWRGHAREIALGPQAQAIVREFLPLRTDEYLFSPAKAVAAWQAERRARRRTKVQPSQVYRRKKNPKRKPAAVYTAHSYAHAITKACRRAGVPHWHPNQLRHSYGTMIRKRYGLDGAQVVLGHARADVTQVYAERDLTHAKRIAAEVG
jgi:integrase